MLAPSILVSMLLTATPAGGEPWDVPFADPVAVARDAAALPPPEGGRQMDVLLRETTLAFDTQGRCVRTYRIVWKALTRGAAHQLARTEARWSPWHQDRPEIRARVVAKGGAVHDLDLATLSEAPIEDDEAFVYGDDRVLHAPLPALDAGVVVEELSVLRDREPRFAAGLSTRVWLGGPARRVRIRVTAPTSVPLRWAVRAEGVPKPIEQLSGQQRTVTWEVAAVPESAPQEAYRLREDAAWPHVAVSTGASWQAVGAGYAALVERQLEPEDVRALAEEIAGSARGRDEVARRILAFVSDRLRYTGLELGASSLVPVRPSELVRRGYGDCKDLALLVVALLRARGHEAFVALLRTTWDEISPALPGIGELDHAIVYVPGRPALWLDPTAAYTPVGLLPSYDQGRLAVVADGKTKSVVLTPESRPSENRTVVVREIHMPEEGRARVVATAEYTGAPAARARADRRHRSPEELKEADQKQAKDLFVAEAIAGATWEGLDDPQAVVRWRVEAERSRWAITNGATAAAVVSPEGVFGSLPPVLLPTKGSEKAPEPRKTPVLLPQAYEFEVTYRVFPPPGYRPKPLPAGEDVRFGPARFQSRFAIGSDGAVEARYHFETGGRRLEAKDAEALRAKVAAFAAEDGPRIQLERTSDALLAQGRGREAIAEIRRLAALHPKEASHRVVLAFALVDLGMIDAARREARAAVALEPDAPLAHRALAWALEHDALRRQLGLGVDVGGAIAEMRRARDLEPSLAGTRLHLAWLLTHDSGGARYGRGAALDDAIVEYSYAVDTLKDREGEGSLVEALLRAGRPAEALPRARAMTAGAARNAALLAAVALVDGSNAAIDEAARLDATARGSALEGAATHLANLRRYREAGALLESAARGTAESARLLARAAVLSRMRRWEETDLDERNPQHVVGRLMFALLTPGDVVPRIAKLVPAAFGKQIEKENPRLPDVARSALGQIVDPARVAVAAAIDAALSVVDVTAEGDPGTLKRLRMVVPSAKDGPPIYVVEERGAWKIAGLERGNSSAALGPEIRRLVTTGRIDPARRLLGWARKDFTIGNEVSPGALLAAVAPSEAAPASADELLRAAAVLDAATVESPAEIAPAVAALQAARGASTGPAWRAITYLIGLLERKAGHPEAALAAIRELRARDAAWMPGALLEQQLLGAIGRRDEIGSVAEARIRAMGRDRDGLRLRAEGATWVGDLASAERDFRELAATEPSWWNEVAWVSLFRVPLSPAALDEARRAVDASRGYGPLHTLATVHAARGEPAEAFQVLREAVGPRGVISSPDWLVIGWIAECYGLDEDAAAAYGRVREPTFAHPIDSWSLARARLAGLPQKGRAPAPIASPAASR